MLAPPARGDGSLSAMHDNDITCDNPNCLSCAVGAAVKALEVDGMTPDAILRAVLAIAGDALDIETDVLEVHDGTVH